MTAEVTPGCRRTKAVASWTRLRPAFWAICPRAWTAASLAALAGSPASMRDRRGGTAHGGRVLVAAGQPSAAQDTEGQHPGPQALAGGKQVVLDGPVDHRVRDLFSAEEAVAAPLGQRTGLHQP